MESEVQAVYEFCAEQRDMEWRLIVLIEQSRRARYQEAQKVEEWALRRAQPNPKFDDEWKI